MRVFRLIGALAGLALFACHQSQPLAPLASADPRVQRSVGMWPVVQGSLTVQP